MEGLTDVNKKVKRCIRAGARGSPYLFENDFVPERNMSTAHFISTTNVTPMAKSGIR
jgi:hypothetical protein